MIKYRFHLEEVKGMETLRLRIEQLIEDLENDTENRHMNDMEQGRYDALNEVLEIMDKI